MLNKIRSNDTACFLLFAPFLLPVKHMNGRGSFRCGYPSVLTNPIFWLIPLGANEAPVCGYRSVLSPSLKYPDSTMDNDVDQVMEKQVLKIR